MRYDAILYDLDGTFIDTITLYKKAFCQAFADFGVEVSDTTFTEYYMRNVHLTEFAKLVGVGEKEGAIRNARDDYYHEFLATEDLLFPDAKAFLEARDHDYPRAIITGSWRSYLDAFSEFVDLPQIAEVIITADDMRPHSKPDPYGLHLACEKLGVDASNCMYVGDQLFDIECAHNAGMDGCLIRRQYTAPGDIGAEYEIEEMTELLEIIE